MAEKTRFSVSIDCGLLDAFDELLEEFGYDNRSKAISDLIVEALLKRNIDKKIGEGIFILVVAFDHRMHEITEFYHNHIESIISTLHIHADRDNCVEISVFKGDSKRIEKMVMKLKGMSGVKYAEFIPIFMGYLKDD